MLLKRVRAVASVKAVIFVDAACGCCRSNFRRSRSASCEWAPFLAGDEAFAQAAFADCTNKKDVQFHRSPWAGTEQYGVIASSLARGYQNLRIRLFQVGFREFKMNELATLTTDSSYKRKIYWKQEYPINRRKNKQSILWLLSRNCWKKSWNKELD